MSELTIGFSASASKQEQLNELMGQIMGCYSVSDDEGPLTDAVEVFLKNARQPLWERGEDFKHGTGHGVGYCLSVHESPNGIRWRRLPDRNEDAVLEEGMITSNEPGYYVEGAYGIRHENLVVCKKAEQNEYGQFMCFENLTMVPFDLDAIDPEQMTKKERELLNTYHRQVYETIAPYLNEEEKSWLKEATREI